MHCYILIDRSGSMGTRWDETIGSVNAYVDELSKGKKPHKMKITTVVFDSQSIDIVRRKVKASEWKSISCDEFRPRAMTPLYDAIGFLGDLVNKKKRKSADIIIITDGGENNSKEYNNASAKAIISGFEKSNYGVSFIGADFNAFETSNSVGINVNQTLNMSKGNYKDVMRSRGAKTLAYASTGSVSDLTFSDEDRKDAIK